MTGPRRRSRAHSSSAPSAEEARSGKMKASVIDARRFARASRLTPKPSTREAQPQKARQAAVDPMAATDAAIDALLVSLFKSAAKDSSAAAIAQHGRDRGAADRRGGAGARPSVGRGVADDSGPPPHERVRERRTGRGRGGMWAVPHMRDSTGASQCAKCGGPSRVPLSSEETSRSMTKDIQLARRIRGERARLGYHLPSNRLVLKNRGSSTPQLLERRIVGSVCVDAVASPCVVRGATFRASGRDSLNLQSYRLFRARESGRERASIGGCENNRFEFARVVLSRRSRTACGGA